MTATGRARPPHDTAPRTVPLGPRPARVVPGTGRPVAAPAGGRRSRHRLWRPLLVVVLLVSTGGLAGYVVLTRPSAPLAGTAQPGTGTSARPAAPTGAPAPASSPPAAPVLRETGRVPASGSGEFTYAAGTSAVFGRSGTLRRYRVAVEAGSGQPAEEFAAFVDRTLGDPASWTASGRLRLQRVPGSGAYDFTVYLATGRTAVPMCLAGGVDIRIGGRPYTSCRAPGKVVVNLERWHDSVDHFVAAKVPLSTYRTYVVNHEVGHELGRGHESCPRKGGPAPVMQQQTLFLSGCVANPWPYVGGRRLAGPPVT
jgi:hypothetical protein